MSVNVGTFDRILRLIVGLVLAIAPFATNIALLRVCPLYSLLGMRT